MFSRAAFSAAAFSEDAFRFDTVVDVVAPTLVKATIASDGDSISLLFDEAVTVGSGGDEGFVLTASGGDVVMTYSTGDGSGKLTYTLDRTVGPDETFSLAYTQPGDGIEDMAGNDLATFSDASVVFQADDMRSLVREIVRDVIREMVRGIT